MANKMLIDAAHPEETRVVVLRGNRVEEFDFEAATRKQLRGNIYLAKVTRVEPSLQAAFVDYGGNRHGFLAFSEIHPDYYQIPVADRQALIEAEEREQAQADAQSAEFDGGADEAEPAGRGDNETMPDGGKAEPPPDDGQHSAETPTGDTPDSEQMLGDPAAGVPLREPQDAHPIVGIDNDGQPVDETTVEGSMVEATTVEASSPDTKAESIGIATVAVISEAEEPAFTTETPSDGPPTPHDSEDEPDGTSADVVSDDSVESVGAEDALEEVPERKRSQVRQYKIQEVIKRRQVLLVQVVKEERGNKGAALTTYLSLAGRYSVLMPNTARGGGISRKITSPADRKRLKQVATDLDVPEGMGVILRTAGASRTKAEVKRDFEYLLRLWENVRELTLQSSAPTLVYEEGSLIKRSIRDLYNKDIDEILVAGDDAYREAKTFMRMLMPSHAKNVKPYRDKQPLFARSGIEGQLDAMFSPQVTLRSGGYIVINQTEALVSIDVNSGRSTREHNIEDTAHLTNIEAAEEIARQLRLRDLAGLVVIDFIDMEEKRNNRSVERKLKEALKHDRARIQVGRISHFGLLEMSRQRIRTGVLESTTTVCPACQGTGHVRAPSSVALQVLRSLEEQLLRGVTHHLTVRTSAPVALYVLNQKRASLSELEQRFGINVTVLADETIDDGTHFQVERGDSVEVRQKHPTSIQPDSVALEEDEPEAEAAGVASDSEGYEDVTQERADEDESGGRRRRRRRRRRNGDGQPPDASATAEPSETGDETMEKADSAGDVEHGDADESDAGRQRKRRRGRRGGRRGKRGQPGESQTPASENGADADELPSAFPAHGIGDVYADPYEIDTTPIIETPISESGPEPEPAQQPEDAAEVSQEAGATASQAESPVPMPAPEEHANGPVEFEPGPTPERSQERNASDDDGDTDVPTAPSPDAEDADKPKRSGWWQRRSFF